MNRLQAAGVGARVISDWLGDGGTPVSPMVSAHRAEACIHGDNGKPCYANKPGNWWDWITSQTVQIIMARRRAKDAMKLSVPNEEKLYFCDVCHCDLKTKVHAPMGHIEGNTPADVLAQLPYWCWMQKEK